jgi:EAL domain-containing protein (putative c-di-GMP-specific phosphodiesterase class I)
MNSEFLDQILAALERSGCPPEVLKIELTEGVSMERMDNRGATLQRFRDQGLKISLDDFGTGFSNLAILPKLPIDELKIDRGIISGLIGDEKSNRMSRDLCKSFIEVGKSHGIRIVAEGIEDIAQADLLLDLGCELGQGYLYARPLPVAEFCDWLSRSPEQ